MAKRQIMLSFNSELVTEPIIYNLGMQFNLVTNIIRGNVTEEHGWMVLQLDGDEHDIDDGISWVISRGVMVNVATDAPEY